MTIPLTVTGGGFNWPLLALAGLSALLYSIEESLILLSSANYDRT